MRFDIDLLKTFIAVADTGSVKLASDRVARSSAAVSMQMKKLEQLVGGPIFQREAGRTYYLKCLLMKHKKKALQ